MVGCLSLLPCKTALEHVLLEGSAASREAFTCGCTPSHSYILLGRECLFVVFSDCVLTHCVFALLSFFRHSRGRRPTLSCDLLLNQHWRNISRHHSFNERRRSQESGPQSQIQLPQKSGVPELRVIVDHHEVVMTRTDDLRHLRKEDDDGDLGVVGSQTLHGCSVEVAHDYDATARVSNRVSPSSVVELKCSNFWEVVFPYCRG